MESMVRKQIYLKRRPEQQLKRRAAETGLSEAELIRQALDHQLSAGSTLVMDPEAWQRERGYLAELIAKGPVAGGRSWRREDLHER